MLRLRPTSRQHIALAACVESHRELYNAALQERRDGWSHSKTRISYGDQSAQLTEIRSARPDVAVWSFSSQQATLRRLNKAFAGFFRRVKTAKPGVKAGYPRFKGAARFDSVEWPKDGDGARWLPEQRRVYLQGIGQVKVHLHRQVQGRVKTIQIKRAGRRWMLVLSCDEVPANPLPATGRQAGIDVGIVSFATTSDGEHIDNPRWGRAAADRLAAAQQRLQRAKRRFEEPSTPPGDGGRPASQNRQPAQGLSPQAGSHVRCSPTTFWWWRIYRSPTCCAGPNPCPTRTSPAYSSQMEPGRSPGSAEASVTPAGVSSSQFCAPKRKMLGAPGLRSTPGTPPTAARPVGMQHRRIASRKRNFVAALAAHCARPTNTPRVTFYGLDWPFTRKPREKKPAASSRRRSHRMCSIAVELVSDGLKRVVHAVVTDQPDVQPGVMHSSALPNAPPSIFAFARVTAV